MAKLEPIIYRDWRYGMTDSVANSILPEQYLQLALNVSTDEADGNKLGNIKGRKGYTIIGDQLTDNKNVLGLANWVSSDQSSSQLVATINDSGDTESRTYYYTGSEWLEIGVTFTSWTAGKKMRFANFLDLLWAANGTDIVRTWDGTGTDEWSTTKAVNAPVGNLIATFYSRMNIAGVSSFPSRLYYLAPDSSYDMDWSAVSFIDINPNDGDQITALEKNSGILLIFKNRYLYTWNGVQTQPDAIMEIGTPSQEAVTSLRGVTYYFGVTYNSAGIYEYRGSYPIEVSRQVRGWLNSMSTANYSAVSSWSEEDHVYFYIGDVTYTDGITYQNVVLRYCVSKQIWSVYTLNDGITSSVLYVQSDGTQDVVLGTDDGSVVTWNSGNSDNGSDIEYRFKTKELELGSRYMVKTIKKFVVYSDASQMLQVRVRVDGKKWHDLGQANKPVQLFETNLRGYWFEFEFGVMNEGVEPVSFDGIEFIDVETDQYFI